MRRMIDRKTGREVILANLSRFHPDWGMSPEQHEKSKAERASGKKAFTPKDQLRTHRLGLAKGVGL
jgi:hypothetical protein